MDNDEEDDEVRVIVWRARVALAAGDGTFFKLGGTRVRRLRSGGDPISDAACSAEKRSSLNWRCRREGSGVDTMERPDITEELQEVSDSSSPWEESTDGER